MVNIKTISLCVGVILALNVISSPLGLGAELCPPLRVGADYNCPPFTFLDEEQLPAGHDVDMMEKISALSGLRFTYHLDHWSEVQAQFQDNQIDILLTMAKTTETADTYDLTIPYITEEYVVFAHTNQSIKTLSDLNNKKCLVLEKEPPIMEFLQENNLSKNTSYTDTAQESLRRVNAGEYDFTIVPYSLGIYLIKEQKLKNLYPVVSITQTAEYRLAVRKGDAALLSQLNEAISQIQQNGTQEEIRANWAFYNPEETGLAAALKASLFLVIPLGIFVLVFMLWSLLLRQEVHEKTRELYKANKMLRTIIDNIPQRVFWKDADFCYVDGNKPYYADIGVDGPAEFSGKTDFDMFPASYAERFRNDDIVALTHKDITHRYTEQQPGPDGKLLWLQTSKSALLDEGEQIIGILGTYEDISEKKEAEEKLQRLLLELEQKNAILEKLAITDHLTGLYNRRFITDQMIAEAAEFVRSSETFCIGVFDLDGLKAVNDNCGHYTGDKLLLEASKAILASIAPGDFAARHGGDEFVVLFGKVPIDIAFQRCEEIRQRISQITLPDCHVSFGISGGVAQYNGGPVGKLLQTADRRLYTAKARGRNIIISQ